MNWKETVSSIAAQKGLPGSPEQHFGYAVMTPLLETIRQEGCVIRVLFDGGKNIRPFTCMVEGYTFSADDYEEALGYAIILYAKKHWNFRPSGNKTASRYL